MPNRSGGVIARGTTLTLALLLTSCGTSSNPTPEQEGSGTAASGSGADGASSSSTTPNPTQNPSTSSEGQTGSASNTTTSAVDSSAGPDTTTGEPTGESGVVRFVAFGDQGEGNEAQVMVATAAEMVCADRGCDFALLLGDNFYDVGVTSAMDQQFVDKFELPYEGLAMPFYVVLGNHDYGTLANDWARGAHQIEYTNYSDRWVMPHYWYTFSSETGGTQFFMFDSARMMWNHDVNDQRDWMATEMAASTAYWKIAVAHHPYLSNGEHGNAGNYEGIPGLPFISGVDVKDFVDDFVCGNAQVYISGHDHNRQVFDPVCGTYFFVSGASSKTSDFVFRDDNPTQWGDDQREGFLWVQIAGHDLTATFYDLDGNLDHELTATL
ncbi:metallophosphoesterase [Paraliomyxa miuraensis]|uniref:metallophosphoesterase n=1 Tax=Paraliomyxa miuraensis TaxID=376150 RepID=UPI0022543E36|nr:metallophosphoesterase [Paraliomyxa miuraensis]MCX4244989.1 metallophosphoesterase [Paraliomyxa miuraensis]